MVAPSSVAYRKAKQRLPSVGSTSVSSLRAGRIIAVIVMVFRFEVAAFHLHRVNIWIDSPLIRE